MTRHTSHPTVPPLRRRRIKRLDMKLSITILVSSALAVATGSWLDSPRHSRESKWDIIHHEYHGPPAPLAKDGRVIDTSEVAEARANHLAIHAETIADLVKIMSEAESEGQPEAQPQASPQAPPAIPPEIMAMILGQGQQEEAKVEKKKEEEEAAPKEEEVKPIVEPEVNNEVDAGQPTVTLQSSYEGPLATIGEDGRVLDTPEVKRAKEAHYNAYKEVAKLTAKEDEWKPIIEPVAGGGEESVPEEVKNEVKLEARAWYEQPLRRVYVPPVHLIYDQDAPVGYQGPAAPLGEDGRVVDTAEVERAKAAHWRAYQHAQDIAKRHPPKSEDNSI